MDNRPFSHAATPQEPPSSLRRSTRLEFVTPVFLSGRDATGQRFRELTQTVLVNLHGCKLRTSYHVLVGMLVTLECPKAGTTGKAVCVKVWDAPAGVVGHEIAVQLIRPENLWNVPDPPADWEIVAKTMVTGPAAQAEPPTPAAAPPAPVAPPVSTAASPSSPAEPSPVPLEQTSPLGTLTVDLRLAELEGRSARLLETFLDIMRTEAEEVARTSLEEFRQQVEVLLRDAEDRLRQSIHQSHEASASSLTRLGGDLIEQMTSRNAQLIRSGEETLRTRLRELLGTQDRAARTPSPKQASQK